jgi:hypothetical protein
MWADTLIGDSANCRIAIAVHFDFFHFNPHF